MKQQKGFDWYKCVIISMFAVGIGCILFSLVFWRIFFYEEETFKEDLEVHTIRKLHGTSNAKRTYISGERKSQVAPALEEFESPTNEAPILENLEEDLKMLSEDLDLYSDLSTSQDVPSSQSEQPDTSETDAEIQTLETEITELFLDYGDAIDQLEMLANEPYADPDVVYKYIVARRESGVQIVHKSLLYQILTGDRDAVNPGGWIYECGKTVGFEIRHEDEL